MSSTLPANLPSIARAKLPAVYEEAKGALVRLTEIDECKDWADKAEALASYAKQAQDDQLRKMADRIQARAILQCGKLLKKIEKATGKTKRDGSGPLSRKKASARSGLSERQRKTALRVANLPEEDFEAAVESDNPPTVTALAEKGKKPAATFDLGGRNAADVEAAAHALGWIRNLHNFSADHKAKNVAAGLLHGDKRLPGVRTEIKAVMRWLDAFMAAIEKRMIK